MDNNEKEFKILIDYFKSLRDEIHARINQHANLVWIKVLSLGAIISYLMNVGQEIEFYSWFILVIPLLPSVFDFLIAGNLRNINNIGQYIRDHFESTFFRPYINNPDFKLWEECAAQAILKYRCYTCVDVLIIWLFTFLTFCFSIMATTVSIDVIHIAIICVVGFICLVALWYLIRSITMVREFLYPRIKNIHNVKWKKIKTKKRLSFITPASDALVSTLNLKISGYVMNFYYIPPNSECIFERGECIISVLRGNAICFDRLNPMHERPLNACTSISLIEGSFIKTEDERCLLFVCEDRERNANKNINVNVNENPHRQIEWYKFKKGMYKTVPQLYIDKYRVNLWYLDSNVHGGIHKHDNEPIPFKEFHTQLRGDGRMVKYDDETGINITEDITMTRGNTHTLFWTVQNNNITYPWHEYVAGEKGSLFIAFEDTK